MRQKTEIYGLMAEFEAPVEILRAARRARQAGYRHMDAYSPYPVEGLPQELGLSRTRVPFVVLIGGFVGAFAGYGMQYYAAVISYPINVGGRPLNSWPVFIPITFEMMVLIASFAALIGMFALNGMPMPYHAVFNVPEFARASQDRFFLCIQATDPQFDRERTREFLTTLRPHGEIREVPH
jgi:hypothetical protein